jgi:hypothetical protein
VHKKSYERRERKDPKRPKNENITTRGVGETMYNGNAGAPKLSQNNVQWNLFQKTLRTMLTYPCTLNEGTCKQAPPSSSPHMHTKGRRVRVGEKKWMDDVPIA